MFFFRRLRLTHLILAFLLWCTGSFVFAGITFARFDTAAAYFKESRYQAVLRAVKQTIQFDIDNGTTLPKLNDANVLLARYLLNDKDVLSLFLVDFTSGRVAFSTLPTQTGVYVDAALSERCARTDSFFKDAQNAKTLIGASVSDSANNPTGCLCLEYKNNGLEDLRDTTVGIVVQNAVFLALTGILLFTAIFLAIFVFKVQDKAIKTSLKVLFFSGLFVLFFGSAALIVVNMNARLDTLLHDTMTLKTKTLSRIMQRRLQKALEAGVPLKFLNGVETVLDGLKQKHPEIVFILVTDEAGRVLYAAGNASKAFDADAHTGKVSLRKGYGNVAEPLRGAKGTQGWIQIGIRERYARDTFF